jgi:hypothetical protein
MAIFGSLRDINTFKTISRELVDDVISQQCGYYKIALSTTQPNMYGESHNKTFIGPILLNCLIERGDFTAPVDEFGPDVQRTVVFRFLRDYLAEVNLFPEIGDVVMYNEVYYEVDNVNENQLIVGKDNSYSYSDGLENFGNSYSVVLQAHYTRPDRLGITQQRL